MLSGLFVLDFTDGTECYRPSQFAPVDLQWQKWRFSRPKVIVSIRVR